MIDRLVGPAIILLCTVIWGAAFLAQKLGADHFGPFTLNCYRNLLGGGFLALAIVFRRGGISAILPTRGELTGGAVSGVVLFAAMMAQQLGIERTTPGISAFLTANYVLLVPLFAWVVGRGRPSTGVVLGAALALVGTSCLCLADDALAIGCGESWTLLCAALFAVQILVVDRFIVRVDIFRFSMVQLLAAAAVAVPFVFLPSELARTGWGHFVDGLPALLFVGILSSGIAYTLQNLGQARTAPSLAAIIMSTESVFGAIFGWVVLGDVMTCRQLLGCGLLFFAVVISQTLALVRGAER